MEVLIDNVVPSKSFWRFEGEVKYVDDWFLMRTPITLLLITVGYLCFILKLGPEYMRNKPAYNLRTTLALYNAVQVGLSCCICHIGINILWTHGLISTSCLMDREDTKAVLLSSMYMYFFAKVTELLDTIFFVLKKNYRQVTFLHVYHHCLMVWSSWLVLKYEPSVSIIFLGTLNSFVHVVMYGYYGLSTFPGLQKYLWWKKYITKLQIAQFLVIILHAIGNYICSGCPPSYTLLAVISCNSLLFIGLFTNFYLVTYKKTNELD